MEEQITDVKQLLVREYGFDLPISGGTGTSKDSPIVVELANPEEVALTQMLVLKGLGCHRGIFWRVSSRSRQKYDPNVEKIQIETVKITPTGATPTLESYYFMLSGIMQADAYPLPTVVLHRDASGLSFPFGLGWTQHERSVFDETAEHGLRTNLLYTSPGVSCTISIYDKGMQRIPDHVYDSRVWDEFRLASKQIQAATPGIVSLQNNLKIENCLIRYHEHESATTALLLTTSRGRFLQMRVTWDRNEFIERSIDVLINDLVSVARHGGRRENSWYRLLRMFRHGTMH